MCLKIRKPLKTVTFQRLFKLVIIIIRTVDGAVLNNAKLLKVMEDFKVYKVLENMKTIGNYYFLKII